MTESRKVRGSLMEVLSIHAYEFKGILEDVYPIEQDSIIEYSNEKTQDSELNRQFGIFNVLETRTKLQKILDNLEDENIYRLIYRFSGVDNYDIGQSFS